ncbi:WG repeat-containing protein [Clostridium gasigenes]|uniref:WG repeat-containing protein n=1 Tax=Clostridium gasigenes TaxID=94869 RepID=A0A7X0VRU0_9CLOT|nr:WG repeat-containing protein [Clostridium gasigenes]MBB6623159.1 WG repeat-containing protein [Clostridium gasigenes]MBB6714990.1 WG repeat-containing protein [Clostridium gasigenes]
MSLKTKYSLYPALVNTKDGANYGYINRKSIFKITPQFTVAYDFNDSNRAIVSKDDKYGLIDTEGNLKVNLIYSSISPFKEGLAVYTLNDKMGVMDKLGNSITKKNYNFINDYSNGMALVGESDGSDDYKYGYLNKDGVEVIPTKYKQANDFNGGYAVVKIKDGEFALIDLTGKLINKYNYQYVGGYGEGLMFFSNGFGEKYGYINVAGEIVIEPTYFTATGFKDGMAIVSIDEGYNGPNGVINNKGKYIYSPIYSNINLLGEDRVSLGMPIGEGEINLTSIYAIGNNRGDIFTDFKFLVVGNYNNGLSYGSNEEYTFFIDKSGKPIKDLPKVKGSGTLEIKDGIVYSDIDYEPYYLNKDGSVIYKPNKKIILSDKYSVIKEKYKPNINYLIYYPVIIGVYNKKINIEINKKLWDMSYFTPYAEEGKNKNSVITKDDVLDYSYYGNFTIEFYKKDLLVLNLSGYYYPIGAAHGMPSKKTPCINLVTGKFYSLGDLFMGGVYYTGELNKIINNMIETDPQYEYVFKDAFKGITEKQDFYVDKDNLYIYYPPYEIGPYSAGFITFKINFDEIKGMINKNGEFYKSFN